MYVIEQQFTFTRDDGITFRFNIPRIQQHCLAFEQPFLINTNPEAARDHMKSGTIDKNRLKLVTRDMIENQPIIMVQWEDETHTIIDGNHRHFRAVQLGFREIPSFILEKRVWEKFLVDGPTLTIDEIKALPAIQVFK